MAILDISVGRLGEGVNVPDEAGFKKLDVIDLTNEGSSSNDEEL